MARFRVSVWGTGNVGARILREVVRDPGLQLVGLVVYSDDKAGRDAGELCGEPATGVLATTDRTAGVRLGADCALYAPSRADVDDLVALLSAGTDVVTTCSEFVAGGSGLHADVLERLETACQEGNSTLFGTGSSPGFVTEILGVALLALQRRVDLIEIEEFADMSSRDSPLLLFDVMGFGKPAGPPDPRRAQHLQGSFGPSLALLAREAGHEIDEWEAVGEVAATRTKLEVAAGEVPAGGIAGQRTVVTGLAGGRPVARFTATWFLGTDLDADWELQESGWRIRVHGDVPLDVRVSFPVAPQDYPAMTPSLTANPAINAIPGVLDAPAGLLAAADLPYPITPDW